MDLRIRPREADDGAWLKQLWIEEWGGTSMVIQNEVVLWDELEAFLAWEDGERVGALTYRIKEDEAEIISLNALRPGKGIGSRLIRALEEQVRQLGLARISLITTNDNLEALAFYQKRGFRLVEIFLGAVDEARKQKPTIPLIGNQEIPIHDEWKLVKDGFSSDQTAGRSK